MDQRHTRIVGKERHIWDTQRLWEASSGLPKTKVSIESIPEVDINCWFESREPTLRAIAGHAVRIATADLSYPIILNDCGELMDGGHRICKALSLGHSTILAVRFSQTPEPDESVDLDA